MDKREMISNALDLEKVQMKLVSWWLEIGNVAPW